MTKKMLMALVVFLLIAGLLYGLVIRPWFLWWGATNEEIYGTWPGDDIIPGMKTENTRAITINAKPSEIWPWLMQMGQGRGGLYSYDWLENLIGLDIHSANNIIPEFQNLDVGERIWMAPKEKFDGKAYDTVGLIESNRALVLITPGYVQTATNSNISGNGIWSFILSPVDEHTTRLIIRGRSVEDQGFFETLVLHFAEPIHFIMERKMMLGIKERAEQTYGS